MANIVYVTSKSGVTLAESDFGTVKGETVKKFTWKTENGLEVAVITYGAIIQAVKYPDKDGVIRDIALGFDKAQDYVTMNVPDLAASSAVASTGSKMPPSNWMINWTPAVNGMTLILSYFSKNGDQGYPGDLLTTILYEVKNDDTFHIKYVALANKKTVVNLTNHSYFNLAGHDAEVAGLNEHTVIINSDKLVEADENWIPTGHFKKIGGTPFDFRTAKRLGDLINHENNLRYHHNFVINKTYEKAMDFVSRVEHPSSGRWMEVHSDQPSVVFYTGNYIQGQGHPDMIGKGGHTYGRCAGFCLEPMNLVDAIHHEHFPSPILDPGHVYTNKMFFSFGTISA